MKGALAAHARRLAEGVLCGHLNLITPPARCAPAHSLFLDLSLPSIGLRTYVDH